jgi:hypothetical protein
VRSPPEDIVVIGLVLVVGARVVVVVDNEGEGEVPAPAAAAVVIVGVVVGSDVLVGLGITAVVVVVVVVWFGVGEVNDGGWPLADDIAAVVDVDAAAALAASCFTLPAKKERRNA